MNERRTWITMALDLARACKAALTPFSAPAKAVEAARVATPSVRTQCVLAGVSRATVYAHQRAIIADAGDLVLCQLIDGQYTHRPFYGSRRMALFLRSRGHTVNRKRVQRLTRGTGLAGMAPGPNTSGVSTHPAHKIYPYLLRGVAITRPNQVWSTDITYIRLNHGFAYLVAVMIVFLESPVRRAISLYPSPSRKCMRRIRPNISMVIICYLLLNL